MHAGVWCVFSVQASRGEHGPKPEGAFLITGRGGRQRPVDHCECARTRARFNFKKCGAQKSADAKPAMREEISCAPSSSCSSTLSCGMRALRRYCVTVRREPRTSCKKASGSMTRAYILAAFPLSRRGSLGHLEVVQSSSHAGVLAARQLELRPHLVERLLEHVTCAPQCGASETAPPSRLRATPDAPNSSAMSSIFLFISAISASLSARACPLPRRSSSSSALA